MLSKMMHPVNPWTEQLTLLPSPQAPMIMRRVAVLAVVVVAYAVVSRIVHIHRFASLSYTLPSAIMLLAVLCFVPTGAMVSKVRAHWGGIATLVFGVDYLLLCYDSIESRLLYPTLCPTYMMPKR